MKNEKAEAAKRKRGNEKEQRLREATEKKDIKIAYQVLAKLSCGDDLAKLVKDRHYSLIPDWAKKNMTELLTKVKDCYAVAMNVTKKPRQFKLQMTVDEVIIVGGASKRFRPLDRAGRGRARVDTSSERIINCPAGQ